MLNEVTKYLILHKQIALPGIGNFSVETKPAQLDFANRSITSKENTIEFTNDKNEPGSTFYNFLSYELKTDEVTAKQYFNEFIARLRYELNEKKTIYLKGIGRLTRQNAASLAFEQEARPVYFPKLIAEKIIRKNAGHTVRVGEDERTSEEMHTVLHQAKTLRKEKWWVTAGILALIGIAAIIFYYAVYNN
ncbi:hypothetical protein [Parafilimonas sp.]|uniref:hypothetical protein n=1 Tax=Parafilimonas sp. TaxID=1969739 RepID=UPI003F7E9295